MMQRLPLAIEAGALADVTPGTVLVMGAPPQTDLSGIGAAEITILHEMMPDAADWQTAGHKVVQAVPEDTKFDITLVALPRAKKLARARIAAAVGVTSGVILVDGQKTDGVEALMKDVRRMTGVSGAVSKAHGKLFWFAPAPGFDIWAEQEAVLDGRWHVRPGVFSADGVDPGSALLAAALPPSLSGRVADLGAGWGFLSGMALGTCPDITEIHLVEVLSSALDCARRNVTDPRARFHWADATRFTEATTFDHVLMNPPFHSGRATNADLGRNFIDAAARLLRPGGSLWMVANRHLPYEAALRTRFAQLHEIGDDRRYKLFQAVMGGRKRGAASVV